MEHPENAEEYTGLTVKGGIAQPPKVIPYFRPHKRKRLMTAGEYVEGILKGDVTVLSRAVSRSYLAIMLRSPSASSSIGMLKRGRAAMLSASVST